MNARIESLLSARLFQVPQIVNDKLYFVSNLSGRLSLYAMEHGGSVPQPLLPPHLALQNPHHVPRLFQVYPSLGQILLMLDSDGDEQYQPMFVPLDGGFPEPLFAEVLADYRVQLAHVDEAGNVAYFFAESRREPLNVTFRADLAARELTPIYKGMYGAYAAGANDDNTQVALIEGYTAGDNVLYLWEATTGRARLLNGRPLDEREPGEDVPLTSFGATCFVPSGRGLLITTSLFEDTYGLGYIALAEPETVARVEVRGAVHQGLGEMENLKHLRDNRYAVQYNIDGESWLYEGEFDEDACAMRLDAVICGRGQLSGGVMDSFDYDKAADRYALSFSTATSPTQIYTIEGAGRNIVRQHTIERVLGLPQAWLSPGEDASFTSHDGLLVSGRLSRPSPYLG